MALINYATVFQGIGAVLLDRIVDASGNYITQSAISSIAVTSYDITTDTQISTGSLTVNTTVFNSLQTADPRWIEDTLGFNSAYQLAGTYWPNAGIVRLEIIFTPTSGNALASVWQLTVLPMYSRGGAE